MSLRSRIVRLESALGDPNAPKRVVISTGSDRYSIAWHSSSYLALGIPYPGSPRPAGWTLRGALTDEQRALIGPHDTVRGLLVPPSRRRRSLTTAPRAADRESIGPGDADLARGRRACPPSGAQSDPRMPIH